MKIKSVDKLKVHEFDLIVKVIEKDSKIISTDESVKSPMTKYMEVVVVGNKIEDVEVGDVIVDFRNPKKEIYTFKIGKQKYAHLSRHDVLMVTTKDNLITDDEKLTS